MTPPVQHILQAPARGHDDYRCSCGSWTCHTLRKDFAKDQHVHHREKVAA